MGTKKKERTNECAKYYIFLFPFEKKKNAECAGKRNSIKKQFDKSRWLETWSMTQISVSKWGSISNINLNRMNFILKCENCSHIEIERQIDTRTLLHLFELVHENIGNYLSSNVEDCVTMRSQLKTIVVVFLFMSAFFLCLIRNFFTPCVASLIVLIITRLFT